MNTRVVPLRLGPSIILADCLHGFSLEVLEGNLGSGSARPSESGTELA